jgi:uncharacterized Zn-finger protein
MADIYYNPDCLDYLLAYLDNIKSDLFRDLEQADLEQADLERDLENSESSKDPVSSTNNEKPSSKNYFECPEEGCNMTFNRKDSLSRHSRTHNGKQLFSCNLVCKKNFSTRRSRDRHMQNKVCTKYYYFFCHFKF